MLVDCETCKLVDKCDQEDRWYDGCINYKPRPQTNYDRVSKSPEELAKWIAGGVLNLTGGSLEMATEAWADWLKQEAGE